MHAPDNALADQSWPQEELCTLGFCSVCNSRERKILFEGLTDRVFRVAPGRWTLWQCGRCGVAYLDPRPSQKSIGRAYTSYYTNVDEAPEPNGLLERRRSASSRIKQGIRNSYLNVALGHSLPYAFPAPVGGVAAKLSPQRFRAVEHWVRHLPPAMGGNRRLLDIGCGNGAFLRIASALGYEAVGLEPDGNAAAIARRHAFEVKVAPVSGGAFPDAAFSQITLNHVIEHLPHPREALADILRWLVPGGRVWLTQPNLGALGLKEFGRDWLALDPPRHLVLFSPRTLSNLLRSLGFTGITSLPPDRTAKSHYQRSVRVRDGEDPTADDAPTRWDGELEAKAVAADKAAMQNPDLAEAFTIIAFRPS